jgi:hypothetical protein
MHAKGECRQHSSWPEESLWVCLGVVWIRASLAGQNYNSIEVHVFALCPPNVWWKWNCVFLRKEWYIFSSVLTFTCFFVVFAKCLMKMKLCLLREEWYIFFSFLTFPLPFIHCLRRKRNNYFNKYSVKNPTMNNNIYSKIFFSKIKSKKMKCLIPFWGSISMTLSNCSCVNEQSSSHCEINVCCEKSV